MQPFDYAAPSTLEEALQILSQASSLVRPIAGGTDLIAQIKERRVSPSLVLNIKEIAEARVLDYDPGQGLQIGASVSCSNVASYAPVAAHYPSLVQACLLVGSIQIQNRGSVGGNICNAAPSADTVPPLLTYDAVAVIAGPGGSRRVPLEDFFQGPGRTALQPQELLIEVLLPPPPPNSNSRYLRFIPREEMDIAVAGVGSMLAVDPQTNICTKARIALASVAPTPIRAREAEKRLEGGPLTEEAIREAGELAASACSPISDIRGSAAYRKELVKVLTRRTLSQSLPL
jgi:CO/xanthine dehydrogenase FAD-binding subunit